LELVVIPIMVQIPLVETYPIIDVPDKGEEGWNLIKAKAGPIALLHCEKRQGRKKKPQRIRVNRGKKQTKNMKIKPMNLLE